MFKAVVAQTGIFAGALAVSLSFVFSPTSASARPRETITPTEMQLRLAELQQEPWSTRTGSGIADWAGDCDEHAAKIEITDPATRAKRVVKLLLRRPDSSKKVPVMVIVPTIDGVTSIEHSMGSQFCDAGIAVVVADVIDRTLPSVMPGWGLEDRVNRAAILAVRTVLDFAETNDHFDKNKIGMIGASLGGMSTALISGVEADRLKAIVIAVGAGNLPYALAYSTNKEITELRERRMENLGITDPAQYEEPLRQTVRYDPLFFASQVKRERIMMVMGEADVTMPYMIQQETFEAFGRPTQELYSTGHVATIAAMTFWYFNNVIDFVKTRFDGKAPAMDKRINVQNQNILRFDGLDLSVDL